MSTSAAIGDIFFIMISTRKVAIMTNPRIVSMGATYRSPSNYHQVWRFG